jgi:hypothetical protein
MSSRLIRISADEFIRFVEAPELWFDYTEAVDLEIMPPNAHAVHIRSNVLSRLAHLGYHETVLERALQTGQHFLEIEDVGYGYFYLTPEEVRQISDELELITEDDLRASFDMYGGIQEWLRNSDYPDERSLLAAQQHTLEQIRQFYDHASGAGEAVIIEAG